MTDFFSSFHILSFVHIFFCSINGIRYIEKEDYTNGHNTHLFRFGTFNDPMDDLIEGMEKMGQVIVAFLTDVTESSHSFFTGFDIARIVGACIIIQVVTFILLVPPVN